MIGLTNSSRRTMINRTVSYTSPVTRLLTIYSQAPFMPVGAFNLYELRQLFKSPTYGLPVLCFIQKYPLPVIT